MREAWERVLAIAANTFKEAVRNRAFLGLMLGALALILASLIVSELVVFDQRRRVVQDFGLFFISFGGVVISIIVGVLLVYKELERKTIYSLLSKPVERWEFILGRYAGMFGILVSVTAVLALAWVVVMLLCGVQLRVDFFKAVLLVLGELSIVGAVAVLFSSFSTPILSGIFTFGIFVLGRHVNFIETLLTSSKGLFVTAPALRPVGKAVGYVFPDLSLFDITREILLEVEVPWAYVAHSTGYALCYVLVIVSLAAVVFQRRDFV